MRHGTWEDPVRPDGGKKRKRGQKVRRKPMYVPASDESRTETATWLRGR